MQLGEGGGGGDQELNAGVYTLFSVTLPNELFRSWGKAGPRWGPGTGRNQVRHKASQAGQVTTRRARSTKGNDQGVSG